MEWTVHGERTIYDSPWLSLRRVDVEIPGGRRFEHHVVRSPGPAVGTIVRGESGLLLLYRHRVLIGRWGWEIPAGGAEPNEPLASAAARETLEETGWRPGQISHCFGYDPMNGLSDQRFEVFLAEGATSQSQPQDQSESSVVEWVDLDRVRELIRTGSVSDGLTLTALLWWFSFGRVLPPREAVL
jgi:8-oxo-dGTP pyrophosphatase MutT (NUDIX family)